MSEVDTRVAPESTAPASTAPAEVHGPSAAGDPAQGSTERSGEPAEQLSLREALASWSEWLRSVGGIVLALLLWWPVSFAGRADFLTIPGGVGQLGAVILGLLTSGAFVALLVPSPWPRFAIAVGLPAIAILRSSPGGYPPLALGLMALALAVGVALGAWGTAAVSRTAVVLGLLAGLGPSVGFWWGPVLALALALPFLRARADRVAPTVVSVVAALVAWLVGVVLRPAVEAGFRGSGGRPGLSLLRDGLTASGVQVRDHGEAVAPAALSGATTWYVVAAVLAAVIVAVRGAHGRLEARRTAS